jgi:hypothetical protein
MTTKTLTTIQTPAIASKPLEGQASVGRVVINILRNPTRLVQRWNWKSAILSSLVRGLLFFFTNLSAGTEAAVGALMTEFFFRAIFSGFYGALTESFRHAQPRWAATLVVIALLPLANHSVELAIHSLRHTPRLLTSIATSVAFTFVSTAFNLYAMRHGALIVGAGRQSLLRDILRLPLLLIRFVSAPLLSARRLMMGNSNRKDGVIGSQPSS